MSMVIACPECQARVEISDVGADQSARCHQCQHPFAVLIAPSGREPARNVRSILPQENGTPMQRPRVRSPFPLTPFLILVIGILLMLLVLSVGFNVWTAVGSNRENRFQHAKEVQAMEQDVRAQRDHAMQVAEDARHQQVQAQNKIDDLQRENVELKRQVESLKELLAKEPVERGK